MQDELQTFLESPTAHHYRLVREALLEEAAGKLPTTVRELSDVAELSAAGEHTVVLERVDELMPWWSLSPRIHFYAALAADELGEIETAELERFVFQSCLEGLLATGEGTAESPYLITYPSDALDVLTALGLEARSQSLVDRDGLLCDVVTCAAGEEVWFEVASLIDDPRQHQVEFAVLQGFRR
ncbi:MAG TPA: hypothetical protein VL096_13045 [Pirellulaceae bacterium]|nr:hypothetical protein [Pirellulaceae bacterium]